MYEIIGSLSIRIVSLSVMLSAYSSFALHAQQAVQQCEMQCKTDCDDANPLRPNCPACVTARANCIAKCDKKCQPGPVVPVFPRYMVITIVYAPPGCSSGSAAACAQVSKVDYANGSSNGTKNSTDSSFKAGFNVSVDEGLKGGGTDWSVSAGYELTKTDNSSETVTKGQTTEIVASGNADGINHDQDEVILLLNPVVNVQELPGNNVVWNLNYSGPSALIYGPYVSWLKNPSSMPANVAAQLQQLGFTNSDFQTILAQDPFATGSVAIDPNRFVPTTWAFPYEPPLQQSDCNNGVCTCTSFSAKITNELQNEVSSSYQNQYTVGLSKTLGLTGLISLTATESFTWTNGAATTNTKDSSQSATATVVCPSTAYSGPTLMQIYWDTLYGSFFFAPVQLSQSVVMQKGQITNPAGKPVRAQLVELTFGGKTYHTFTNKQGMYQFVLSSARASRAPATGVVSVNGSKQTLPLRSAALSQIRLP